MEEWGMGDEEIIKFFNITNSFPIPYSSFLIPYFINYHLYEKAKKIVYKVITFINITI